MTRARDRRLARFAEERHGHFTAAHLRMLGFDAATIDHRFGSGQWVRRHESVYRLAGVPESWEGDLLAACWAGGHRAVASHRSAAALYDLAGGTRAIVEITCPRWRRARHDGLVVHETKALGPHDVAIVAGIPVTTVERTLLDLGAVCGPRTVRMALDKAEYRELTTLPRVRALLARLARQGRPGVQALREALDHAERRRGVPQSEMETLLVEVLRRHGLPEPILQMQIYDEHGVFVAQVDAGYRRPPIAIEYDSRLAHTGEWALTRDSSRRNRVVRAGYHPVTARSADLRSGGHELAATIRARLSGFGVDRPELFGAVDAKTRWGGLAG